MSVEEDEFAGEDDETLRWVAMEERETMVEQLGEFGRIGTGGRVREATGGVESDARLGGVRDDEADVFLFRQADELLILRVGIECTTDDVYQLKRVDGLSLGEPLEVDMVETVLSIEHIDHAFFDGLDHHHTTREGCLLVDVLDYPVYKRAEEIAFAKLYDTFLALRLRSRSGIECFHNEIENLFFFFYDGKVTEKKCRTLILFY